MFSSLLGGSNSATASGSTSSSSSSGPATATSVAQVRAPKERLANPESAFGPLTQQDTSWLCAGGFTTETQTFYAMSGGKSPKFIMVQVIHSAVGMWYPQIQFTFRFYDPATGHKEWRSANVSGFSTAPTIGSTKYDKRSSKSNEFSILVDPQKSDMYTIEGKYDDNTQVSLKFKRAEHAPGWKLGSGPKGGMTYFGAEKKSAAAGGEPDYTSGADGFVVHRFWPRCTVSGIVRMGNEIISLDGSQDGARGVFIHAIQGMRPNLVACRWNFGYFNSTDEKEGVSLLSMEFTTTYSYGSKTINIGSIVVDDRLVAVISEGSVEHLDTEPIDADTSYPAPGKIRFAWNKGRSLTSSNSSEVKAEILLDLTPEGGHGAPLSGASQPRNFRGLIEKVDVLAQIPYLVKKVISYVAGTKPYIYQCHNSATASISLPADNDSTEPRQLSVDGYIFTETTFISPN